ncbi:MAG: uroporphyrinogen decarboxylase family protein, partial [Eubacterium sp.]
DICDWSECIVFPDLNAWDWEQAAIIDNVSDVDRQHKLLYTSSLNGFFERMHTLMGFENALCSMLTDPEDVEAFLDKMVEFKCLELTKINAFYQPDILNFHDDYGTQKGLFFSPELWRKLFKPRLKKVVEHCHDLGMIFELHSCGLIEDIIEDICEIGVDCLQCMDINDIHKMKKRTGKKMAYGVSPNFQKFAAGLETKTITTQDIQREVHEEVMALSDGGNYYPFINPPFTEMDRVIWDAVERCNLEILATHQKKNK